MVVAAAPAGSDTTANGYYRADERFGILRQATL